jgi:hypothetical protein
MKKTLFTLFTFGALQAQTPILKTSADFFLVREQHREKLDTSYFYPSSYWTLIDSTVFVVSNLAKTDKGKFWFINAERTDSLAWQYKPQTIHFAIENADGKLNMLMQFQAEDAIKVHYGKAKENRPFAWANTNDPYLLDLRAQYPLDSLVSGTTDDFQKALKLLTWVTSLWKHDGMNEPKEAHAAYILEQVAQGERFRCVEYGTVLHAVLTAVGLPARQIGLKMKDTDKISMGAGHVATEVYLPSLKKWVFLDPQFGTYLSYKGILLSAAEAGEQFTKNAKDIVVGGNLSPEKQQDYKTWIRPYLYYLDFSVDFSPRNGKDQNRQKFGEFSQVMLMPLGAKPLTVFQRKYPIKNTYYTHNLIAVYPQL